MSIFKGTATALITPFKDDKIDYVSMGKLVQWQLNQGVDALVICGTTGESSTMTAIEKINLVKFVVDLVKKRVPVIAGTGTNSTKLTKELSKEMQDIGADGLLIVTPYYNKCTDTGLIQHYEAIADYVNLPIIMYSVPSRTGVNIGPSVVKHLALHPNIVAIKEASGNISQICASAAYISDDFDIYSGNDEQTIPIMSLGGSGCISTVSNIIPKRYSDMTRNCLAGKTREAATEQIAIKPLIDVIFAEVNPIPVKYALSLMGMCYPEYRLPLCMPQNKTQYAIYDTLKEFDLL